MSNADFTKNMITAITSGDTSIDRLTDKNHILTTTSTVKLTEIILEAIPKILQLIEVYEYIGDT